MSAIASLLRRVTAEVEWRPGAIVARDVAGVDAIAGRVSFVEEGWIYWAAEDGAVHATRIDSMRRLM